MKYNEPIIVGIDTSCDETSIAILCGRRILSNVRNSQVDLHKEYGGVVPMVARRAHEENIVPVYLAALKRAKIDEKEIDYIAVTIGPGLAIDLEIGITFAKNKSRELNIPVIPINHMEGHLLSSLVLNSKGKGLVSDDKLKESFPALALLMSGKHTEIIYVRNIGEYTKLGLTLDDAAGEAFDKVGRMLNFGYPGGPVVSEFATRGELGKIVLPIPLAKTDDLNFSYSGLKTASLYKIKELREQYNSDKEWIYDFCRAFVESIYQSVKIKLLKAIKQNPDVKSVLVGGGVYGSSYILKSIGKQVRDLKLNYYYPKPEHRGDNAAMIALAGYYNIKNAIKDRDEIDALDRNPRLSL